MHILLESQCGFSGDSKMRALRNAAWLSTHRALTAGTPWRSLQVALGLARLLTMPRGRDVVQ